MKNAFDIGSSSSIAKELERNAKHQRTASKNVERMRAQGKEPMYIALSKTPLYDKPPKETLTKRGKV